MQPITVDELPDFLQEEYPEKGLSCIADLAADAILIKKENQLVAQFSEMAFEKGKVTDEAVRKSVSTWLKNH